MHLAQYTSPSIAVFVTGLVCRYLSGDISLVDDVLKQHDAVHGTTSTATVTTIDKGAKRIVDLEKELEIKASELRLARNTIETSQKHIKNIEERFDKEVGRESAFAIQLLYEKKGIVNMGRRVYDPTAIVGAKGMRLYLTHFATDHGIPNINEASLLIFGRFCSLEYKNVHKKLPPYEPRECYGTKVDKILTNVYIEMDRDIVECGWKRFLNHIEKTATQTKLS